MSKKRKIVIAVVLVLLAGAIGFSVYCKVKRSGLAEPVDMNTALVRNTPAAGDVLFLRNNKTEQLFQVSDDLWTWSDDLPDGSGFVVIPIKADKMLERSTVFYAEVTATDPEMPEMIAQNYREYYQDLLDRLIAKREEGIPEGSSVTPERLDELIDMMTGYISDEQYEEDKAGVTSFTLIAKSLPDYSLAGFISRCIAVLLGIVLLYSVLGNWISGKKLVAGSLALVILAVLIAAVVFRKELATMASVKEYAPGLYVCNVTNDYRLDEVLAKDIRSTDEMIEFGSRMLLGGFSLDFNAHYFACSSFSCVTEDGSHLLGRNYDGLDTEGLILYSDPEGAYASIAVCDLRWLNMGGDYVTVKPGSLLGRYILRGYCPYISADGFNDQGLGLSILSLDYYDQAPDTDNTDTLILIAMRAVLDKCATTDEAIAFLSSYDIHSMYDMSCHLFITDKSGKSVVVEWIEGEMKVSQIDHVTNYLIATHEWDDESRFVTLEDKLNETGGVLSIDEAMDLLGDAAQRSDDIQTEWSCVYDLDHFVLYIYNDCDRNTVYTITPEVFK